MSANDPGLAGHHEPFAGNTTDREKQVRRSLDGRSDARTDRAQLRPAASRSAFFITDWSGSSPNQHSNAATPW